MVRAPGGVSCTGREAKEAGQARSYEYKRPWQWYTVHLNQTGDGDRLFEQDIACTCVANKNQKLSWVILKPRRPQNIEC